MGQGEPQERAARWGEPEQRVPVVNQERVREEGREEQVPLQFLRPIEGGAMGGSSGAESSRTGSFSAGVGGVVSGSGTVGTGGKSREGAGGGARGAGSPAIFFAHGGRSDGRKFREQMIFLHRLVLNWSWWSNGFRNREEPVASQEMEREVEQEEQVPPQFLFHPWREERWEEVREQDLPAQARPQLELVERRVPEQKQPVASQEMEQGGGARGAGSSAILLTLMEGGAMGGSSASWNLPAEVSS